MALEIQAALETAALNAIRASLGYEARNSGRMFDGMPPAFSGDCYLVVWHDGSRESTERGSLAERMGLRVTLSLRTGKYPFDRLVQARDLVEKRLNAVRALLHRDLYDYSISRAAAVLAELETPSVTKPIGLAEALTFQGFDEIVLITGEWFGGTAEEGLAGIHQTARFGRGWRAQALRTAQ